jgi:hypothetical protein
LNATILRPWYVLGEALVAVSVAAHVQTRGTCALNPRGSAAIGVGDFGANDECTDGRGGKSRSGKTHSNCA